LVVGTEGSSWRFAFRGAKEVYDDHY